MKKLENRFEKQIRFIVEIDKLKQIYRQTYLMDGSHRENSAEHSWHLAMMVLVLSEYVKDKTIDLFRVMKMVIIHDLVEIDAGDTFCYDEEANKYKRKQEKIAAKRIFNILPSDQAVEFRKLWDEFEADSTPESHYARAIDRLQPVLHNYHTRGKAWLKHQVKSSQVIARNKHIEKGAPRLWEYVSAIIEESIQKGFLTT